ncbi:SDR family oxidoreductase [Alkalihalobacillus macyae]|uniref:SDR family NAD(P)-dependent oxidoreductase n=1 Tax=Guptibacillus hwajinpoensis TaxID=208199 RepID=UPI00273C4F7A|nr:SDR family oxidoreductase [Alkalihalobacillus macyae]MDP4551852.1 SDR family oxidoreductase [Alkalihalobacillus macyae]
MQQTALITGASGGIGYELAELMAKDGINLILAARSKEKLDQRARELQTYGGQVQVIVSDLSQTGAAEKLYNEVKELGTSIDLLVNNAGVGVFGKFTETNLQQDLDMLYLNINSLTHLTKLVLPDMTKRGKGRILNVASTAAFQPGPLMAVYYASKAYVLSFSEAIENELKGTGVTVSALCPGPTRTDFSERANLVKSKLFDSGTMDSKTVAKVGYEGFMKGKSVIIPGTQNKILAKSIRFLPRKIVTKTVRRMQDEK